VRGGSTPPSPGLAERGRSDHAPLPTRWTCCTASWRKSLPSPLRSRWKALSSVRLGSQSRTRVALGLAEGHRRTLHGRDDFVTGLGFGPRPAERRSLGTPSGVQPKHCTQNLRQDGYDDWRDTTLVLRGEGLGSACTTRGFRHVSKHRTTSSDTSPASTLAGAVQMQRAFHFC
jgi:hypothetical protein